MSVIDIAKSHFENIATFNLLKFLNGKMKMVKPVVIYSDPITLSEKNRLLKKSDTLNDVNSFII